MSRRDAFTLIEVLISVALLTLVLLGLYGSLDLQRRANDQLHEHLRKALDRDKVAMTLYRDLLESDGNLTLSDGEFDRLCIGHTDHSLYGLVSPTVCWLVQKEHATLTRVEGSAYSLPLRADDRVAIDPLLPSMQLFELVRKKSDLLVIFRAKGGPPYSFLLQGLSPPKTPRKSLPAEGNDTQSSEPGRQLPTT